MALTALETVGDGQIQSTERITTQNNKEAYVNQGRQIPVQTTANFTVTTQYVNAGLELRATPQITAEGTIIMTLDIQNNAADFAQPGQRHPADHHPERQDARSWCPTAGRRSSAASTGSRTPITQDRVPFLHQIPILGSLFKILLQDQDEPGAADLHHPEDPEIGGQPMATTTLVEPAGWEGSPPSPRPSSSSGLQPGGERLAVGHPPPGRQPDGQGPGRTRT